MISEVLMQEDKSKEQVHAEKSQKESGVSPSSSEQKQKQQNEVSSPLEQEVAGSKHPKDKKVSVLRSRLEELEKREKDAQFYLDHLQRLQAEFDNFRKRSTKEREEFRKYVLEEFIMELLGILDNFERAIESTQNGSDLQTIVQGVQLIYKQLRDCLYQRGVNPIESKGLPFDPSKHDAVTHEETNDLPPDHVVDQMAKGYLLHGKVIRPSKVKVSKKPLPPLESTGV